MRLLNPDFNFLSQDKIAINSPPFFIFIKQQCLITVKNKQHFKAAIKIPDHGKLCFVAYKEYKKLYPVKTEEIQSLIRVLRILIPSNFHFKDVAVI